MRISAVVADLQDDATTVSVHGISNGSPPCDLLRCVNSRSIRIAVRFWADRGSFGNDEASRRTLRVILSSQRGRSVAYPCTHSGKRGHYNSIPKLNRPKT